MKKNSLLGWVALLLITLVFACKSKEPLQENESNTLIVQMHDSQATVQLEKDYTQYDLQEKKVLSRPMNIFLFTFNSEKIQNTELLELIKKSDLVKEAQLNKNVTLRN